MEPVADTGLIGMLIAYIGQPWYDIVAQIIGIATVLTMGFKSSNPDNKFLNVVLKVLNFLAGNVFKNKNAE